MHGCRASKQLADPPMNQRNRRRCDAGGTCVTGCHKCQVRVRPVSDEPAKSGEKKELAQAFAGGACGSVACLLHKSGPCVEVSLGRVLTPFC